MGETINRTFGGSHVNCREPPHEPHRTEPEKIWGWLAATLFHVLFHSFARKACQKLKLEVYILIFRAPRAGLAPDSWLRQKNRNRNRPKVKFLTFLENAPGGSGDPPGVPGGEAEHSSHENEAQGPRNQ